jgi:O-antigen ligase
MIAGSLFLFAMALVAQLRREVMITIPVLLAILALDRESRVREVARSILIVSIIAFPLIIYPYFETLQMRFHDENPRITEGTDPRVMNFMAGLSAFLESPFIGTGPGSYAKTIMPYMGWFQASFMYSPYNVFMWASVEAGILAAVGLLVLLYGVVREGLRWRRQAQGVCGLVLRLSPVAVGQIFIWFSFGAAWELSLPFFFMGMVLAAARMTKEKVASEVSS